MSGDHVHIHEPEQHVHAVESDLEYFRTKRLEPRVLHFLRRSLIRWEDLFEADPGPAASSPPSSTELRIRAVEDALDELVRAIATATVRTKDAYIPIEDTRRERGDYDPFFRLTKHLHGAGTLEERLGELEHELAAADRLTTAFTNALTTRGLVNEADLAARRAQLAAAGHHNGARIVARAWVDPDFRQRLLTTGRAAVRELDIPPGRLGRLGIAENTPDQHNVVVCTLCSCYPHDLLGDPPWWYRTDEYKERIVTDPRTMLFDLFDLSVPDDVTIRVHDSTSDVRWMVIPQRPEGTETLDEEQLAALVTPESLVGAGLARNPTTDGIPEG